MMFHRWKSKPDHEETDDEEEEDSVEVADEVVESSPSEQTY